MNKYINDSVTLPNSLTKKDLVDIVDLCTGRKVAWTYAASLLFNRLKIKSPITTSVLDRDMLVILNKELPFIELSFWHDLS